MKNRKWIYFLLTISLVGMLTACGSKKTPENTEEGTAVEETTEGNVEEPVETETETEAETEVEIKEATPAELSELVSLLGMTDGETAELLGGGEENWTEDRSLYIGRIYQVSLYEEAVSVFTSCDNQKVVNAVSVWIVSGDREVSQEEVDAWTERLTEFTGVEPNYNEATTESGSKNWKWVSDGRILSLSWLGDTLSISMNPAVGELK